MPVGSALLKGGFVLKEERRRQKSGEASPTMLLDVCMYPAEQSGQHKEHSGLLVVCTKDYPFGY